MTFVLDPKTNDLVRELARRRGVAPTEAIREAVEQALAKQRPSPAPVTAQTLRERLQPLFDKIDAMPRTGKIADKEFFDDMWGQGDD